MPEPFDHLPVRIRAAARPASLGSRVFGFIFYGSISVAGMVIAGSAFRSNPLVLGPMFLLCLAIAGKAYFALTRSDRGAVWFLALGVGSVVLLVAAGTLLWLADFFSR